MSDWKLGERFLGSGQGTQLIVPVDHGLSLGNVKGLENPETVFRHLAELGVDGTLASPGVARRIAPLCHERGIPLIVTLDTQIWVDDSESGESHVSDITLISSVERAKRLGASAVKILFIAGSPSPHVYRDNLALMGQVIEAGEALNVPVMVEPVWFGPPLEQAAYEAAIWHGSRLAMEFGAHILKIPMVGVETTRRIIDWGLPVYYLGGGLNTNRDAFLAQVRSGISAGIRGVVFGRNVWQSDSMAETLSDLRTAIGA